MTDPTTSTGAPGRRAESFGADLRLFAGDLTLPLPLDAQQPDLRRDGGDLSLVTGVENVVQGLWLRLRVHQGELARLGWPLFGSRLHELVGEPNNARTHVKLMAFAREAIERDPRVTEVRSLAVRVLSRDVARLEMTVLLVDRPTPLRLGHDVRVGSP
jgi:phage baseplate assembly protein W